MLMWRWGGVWPVNRFEADGGRRLIETSAGL